ncbi:hypothetical protein FDN13_06745 [Caloramator sp. E03]|uniref:hypothetical protein n=1 Tax=Caloramator sp. E03 TaxID=2576307 RepID=UPI001110B26E|nr:hypothetical protein [Caloramator sp. E03]QCX33433.1 hypothetical protein FDN13_06745 [Caloramator sp. E03]
MEILVDAKEWEILSANAIINYAVSNGFKSLIRINIVENGKIYTKNTNGLFININEYGSENFRLDNKKNIMIMAAMLAHFHNCAEGFVQPQGIKAKVYWGKRAEKYRALISKLERFKNEVSNKENLSQFEEYVMPYLDELIIRAKACQKIFKSKEYLKALEDSMKKKEVCINSASSCTAVVKNGRPLIVKVFDMGYNLCIEDVALLIKHSIEDSMDKRVYKDIIKKYSSIRKIDNGTDKIIKSYVSFPYYTLKTIKKYMENSKDDEEYIDKFKRVYQIEKISNLMEV